MGKVRLGSFWLCDRTSRKKCDRFFLLSLEKAIALFCVDGKKCYWVVFGYAIGLCSVIYAIAKQFLLKLTPQKLPVL
jgi:hypothetical protein